MLDYIYKKFSLLLEKNKNEGMNIYNKIKIEPFFFYIVHRTFFQTIFALGVLQISF
jgi:hypothetical protein